MKSNNGDSFGTFDHVIIATPFKYSGLVIDGKKMKSDYNMQELYSNFIHGRLNGEYFKISQE